MGRLAIDCTDAAGEMQAVSAGIRVQLDALARLNGTIAELQSKQAVVTETADLTRVLSSTTLERLLESKATVTLSIGEFSKLTGLVSGWGSRMVEFDAAIKQVGDVLGTIDEIARTTRMLALNAAIEAARAGEAGRSFAVVADEVKRLSRSTSVATQTITRTVAHMTQSAGEVLSSMEQGVRQSRDVEYRFAEIAASMEQTAEMVGLVQNHTAKVADLTGTISDSVGEVCDNIQRFSGGAGDHAATIEKTRAKVLQMEVTSNEAFNRAVQDGALTGDHEFIELSTRQRDRFVALAEAALADGSLLMEALFDRDYQVIRGSAPERFTTALNPFADLKWRPELERFVDGSLHILSAACTDVNGYLPTCTAEYSRAPTGDYDHDDKWCRHGRIFFSELDKAAKASDAPFFLYVYRRTAGSAGYQVARNVAIPLVIRGRRWGDFECSYICE